MRKLSMLAALAAALVATSALAEADHVVTGSITGTATCPAGVAYVPEGTATTGINVSGTWTATLTFKGSIDGSNYVDVKAYPQAGGASVSTAAANGQWFVSSAGYRVICVGASAYTSGTAVVFLIGSRGELAGVGGPGAVITGGDGSQAQVGANDTNALGNGLSTFPSVARASPTTVTAGRAQSLQMSPRGNLFTEGQIANDVAAAGNPFVTGALATADAAAPAALTAGNTGRNRMSTEGRGFVQTDHPNRFKCIIAPTTATTTLCQAAPGSNSLYVTDVILGESGTPATQTVKLVTGTGATCGTGTADLTMPFGLPALFSTTPVQFLTPAKAPVTSGICAVTGSAVNATNIEIHGYTAP